MVEPICIWPLAATLGEGPVWVAREAALWFTDIVGCRIHRFDPATGERRSWHAPAKPGFVLPAADGRFIAGLKTGLHWFDPDRSSFELFLTPEPHLPGNRLNDAGIGPDGRLWFGSMDDAEEAASGAVYRLGPGPNAECIGGECCITNGPALSPDGRIFYHTDTLARTIHAFDVSPDGAVANPRIFAVIDEEDGYPDGTIVDSAGHLWIGLWGGWRARRYSPDGRIVQEVRFPVSQVTKVALGGPDLRTAFATSARKGLGEAELERQPLAGGLFAFPVDVAGLPVPEVSVRI